jgi:hypothetical protein
MILHHFTHIERLDSILDGGLTPSIGAHTLPPRNVVWLTSAETPNYLAAGARPPAVRIKLVVPSRDRRLVKWDKWASRNEPHILDHLLNRCDCGFDHAPSVASTWIYFGGLPLTTFRTVENTDPVARATAGPGRFIEIDLKTGRRGAS